MSQGAIISHDGDGLYFALLRQIDGHSSYQKVWCADLTEDLEGEVGIIEIAGDQVKGVNVQPGFVEGEGASPAVYDSGRDGSMLGALKKKGIYGDKSQHSAGIYWNWAMRPGWQKWRPNYRYGTISNLSGDTCDVALDACVSTDTPDGQELNCNQSSSLSGVSIEYMDCDGSAFEDGDEVIVKFEDNDWSKPKVIGFKSDPKACIQLVDVTFTINGKTPTLSHGISIVDSTTEEDGGPLTAGGSSTEEDPGVAKEIDISDFVYPVKIYLTDSVEYYTPDANGEYFFYSRRYEEPVGSGHYIGLTGRGNYDPESPPQGDYDYFEIATKVSRTLGATETEYSDEMTAAFTVYTLQRSESGSNLPYCSDCGIAAYGPYLSSSANAYVSTKTPTKTTVSHGDSWCSGDEDIGIWSFRDAGSTNASVPTSRTFISSDEDGVGAAFGGAETHNDWWYYWTMVQYYNNLYPHPPTPIHGQIICEDEGTSGDVTVYTWSMIPIQDKYI